MVKCTDIINYIDTLLEPGQFKDYCPNGLQVEGKDTIHTLISGVSASQALIEAAIAKRADALVVHHGYFWKNDDPCLVGIHGKRVRQLMQHDINLLVYHLPLDAHITLGNNIQLAQKLGIQQDGYFALPDKNLKLGFKGRLSTPMSGEAFASLVASALGREPLYISGHTPLIETIGWCTGAAQDFIEHAAAAKLDAYLTGEASERTFHAAKELGIHFYAAGHHATERYGVAALGAHLAERFGIEHQFVDIENPI